MAWINILSIFFPVGAIYFSTVNTSPASVVGGTWSQLTGGMLGLAGSDGVAAAGSNGGSVKISIDQMPSHIHGNPVAVNNGGDAGQYRSLFATNSPFWSKSDWNNATAPTGGGQNFIPAHSSVYAWKRTA